ncbi:hypothetical protein Pmar_PMAR025030 [Perkinsus marinus ATCC 50983]|uniref:PUB domain-containing protein n=1 Tax=Perkinsus marinus (strain ATCC 50983 / TXsc) TaxID=423536 RepID=C5KZ04_PERM5|nr:hypothetical protein Pmar_PMAR025030 [Perkinsus marinus ATCC 50983]EER10293.1 hypothetical protein Pmar_PMAR025030 [Perkinsus marinus ATCC 50983]|eukprot:XP_002778498.1 hypothetical protein Pmar_PMAR025030 [Perkinsus marinus ATCC 50983]
MSDPSTDKKDEPEATAESSLEPLAVTSTHVFPNLREDQILPASPISTPTSLRANLAEPFEEVTEASSERERLLMELLARETERKKEGEREGRSAVENSADSRDDRVVKMLEEMQRNQLKQHADLIMALKEITAASLSRSEARTGGEGLIVKAGGVVMDDVDDEEEEERGVDRSVVVTTDSTAVGSEAAANTAESGEKKDLEEVVREMDDRMKGTAKMLLGNLVNNPKSDKFRRVNLRTPRFQAQLDTGSAARKLMEEVGFKEEGSYLVWSPSTREGDCEDELGEVKKALALLSGEVKEDGFSLENPQPPGHRLHTMHERWVAEEERINRKLDPLARKIRHLVDLQRDYVAEREEAELRGATFKPAIGESQRMCPGVSRLNGSKAASADEATEQRWKRRERTAQLRGEIERQRMEECSFRPHINSKSSLIAQRRNPFRKSPFEMLYEDASQRRGDVLQEALVSGAH